MTFHLTFCLQGQGKWYEMQDLHVADILPQMITLSESYIQVSQCAAGCLILVVASAKFRIMINDEKS